MARFARRPRRFVGLALVAALATIGISTPAGAASADLFFSEYVEGTDSNRALEVYNGTGAPVNLSTGGYNVQIFIGGRSSAGLTIFLNGSVAAGNVFVLASESASSTVVAKANQLTAMFPMSGDDAVLLRRGDRVIDSIGQVGHDPGSEWGTGLTSTMDNTLRRKASVEAGDTNPWDAFDPAVEWDGFAQDTFDGLGWHACESNAPTLSVVLAPGRLWPPNHKKVVVNAAVTVYDDTDPAPAVHLVSVTSNEPDDAPGGADGATKGDVVVLDEYTFGLRAERSATGGGRVYTVTYRATDACGNSAEAWAIVTVPLAWN